MLFLVSLSVTPLLYKWVTGSWEHVWVLALPVLALILPLLIVGLVGATLWPSPKQLFPEKISAHRSRIARSIITDRGDRLMIHGPHGNLLVEEVSEYSSAPKARRNNTREHE